MQKIQGCYANKKLALWPRTQNISLILKIKKFNYLHYSILFQIFKVTANMLAKKLERNSTKHSAKIF